MFMNKLPKSIRPMTSIFAVAMVLTSYANAQSDGSLQAASKETVEQQFVEDQGGSERINYAGKLRMLSQRIPAAACNLNAGVAPQESQTVLNSAMAEFDRILAALEFGDDGLGIHGAEERRRTVRVIEELHTKFEPLGVALGDVVDGAPSDAAIQVIADGNMDVLEIAKLLVTEVSVEYANQAVLLQSDAMSIDIAGRQRMLTQKTSKEVCLILSNVNAAASADALGGTINVFETSLDALRSGMLNVGILPPPTAEISDGLDEVNAHWLSIKDHLTAVQAGETISDDARMAVFLGLNTTMAAMNRVVGLYSEASKMGL